MITVYTAVFDKNSILYSPDCNLENDVRWVVLTDINIAVPHPWKQRSVDIDWLRDAGKLKEERCKILSHQIFKSDGTLVWIDSNVQLRSDPRKLVGQIDNDHPLGVIGFDKGACIYRRAVEHGTRELLQQIDLYEYRGYPRGMGISDTSILVRKPKNDINWLEWSWWLQVQTFTPRDWVSFDYCLWEMGMLDKRKVLKGIKYKEHAPGRHAGGLV